MPDETEWRKALAEWLGLLPDLTVYPLYHQKLFHSLAEKSFYCEDPRWEYNDTTQSLSMRVMVQIQGMKLMGNLHDVIDIAYHNEGLLHALRSKTGRASIDIGIGSISALELVDSYRELYLAVLEDERYLPYVLNGIYDRSYIEECISNDIDPALAGRAA